MNKLFRTLPALLIAIFLMIKSTPSLLACAMCMGAADDHIGPALNASIFVLLGCTVMALSGFFFFMVYLARRDGVIPPTDAE